MKNWDILKRIIKGDLRPYLVNSDEGIAKVEAIRNSKRPHVVLGELIDLEYPAPIGDKSEVYYWLIKYETRAIEDSLKDLLEKIPNEEQLQQEITRHFLYGLNLKEESKILRFKINEAPEAKLIDEDCHVLGCCETYIDLLLNDLLNFYEPLLPANNHKFFLHKLNSKKLTRIHVAQEALESFVEKKNKNDVPLLKLSVPDDKQEKFAGELYLYLKEKKYIDVKFQIFRRHFFTTDQIPEKLIWRKAVTEIKYIFHYLIIKGVFHEPKVNLDHLIHLHFLDKNQKPLDKNYLSQSLSRLRGSDKAIQIEKDLDLIISNFYSN